MILKEIYLKKKLLIKRNVSLRKMVCYRWVIYVFLCYLKYHRPSHELRGGGKPSVTLSHIIATVSEYTKLLVSYAIKVILILQIIKNVYINKNNTIIIRNNWFIMALLR